MFMPNIAAGGELISSLDTCQVAVLFAKVDEIYLPSISLFIHVYCAPISFGLPGKLDETVVSLGAYDPDMQNMNDEKEQGCKIKLEGNHSQLISQMMGSLICKAYIYIQACTYIQLLNILLVLKGLVGHIKPFNFGFFSITGWVRP